MTVYVDDVSSVKKNQDIVSKISNTQTQHADNELGLTLHGNKPLINDNALPTFNNWGTNNSSSYLHYSSPAASTSMDFEMVDKLLYPEKFIKPQQFSDNTYDEQYYDNNNRTRVDVETVDQYGNINTPTWYTAILSKIERNQRLTSNEFNLKNSYERLMQDYSPFEVDKDGIPITNNDGAPRPNKLYREIVTLRSLIAAHDRNGVERFLRNLPKEKLAAIEAHYYISSPDPTNRQSLREAIKECCLWSGFGWTGINTARTKRIFDLLDKAAATNPHNMANALYQSINNHRIGGLGIDDNRVAKLLGMTKHNKEFLYAVEEEYANIAGQTLRTDISFKWFISNKNKSTINSCFGC